ncbi:MAG: hypothetical protein K6E85_01520 [Lachnospiraceae bacterium]|nr:hypothetical protein [Lachnospiraceae bacterium]
MDFGVSRLGNEHIAVFYAPKAKEVSIKLFRAGESEPSESIKMSGEQNGIYGKGVFSCSFKTELDEYLFEVDGKYCIDPMARQLVGDGKFGIKKNNDDLSEKKGDMQVIPDTNGKSTKRTNKHNEVNNNNSKIRCRLTNPDLSSIINDDKFCAPDFADMILYKLHVRGFSMHPSSGVKNRGTFAGLTEKIPYLKELGINSVLLMPCYDFKETMDQGYGVQSKLNFWGYGAKSRYFAPKSSYAADPANVCREFAEMVTTFHKAGIAVLMEMDFARKVPDVVMLEALRYWKGRYHVDGFRIIGDYAQRRIFATDPCLNGTLLIGSSWDDDCVRAREPLPSNLADCNDTFMVSVRRFIKGDEGQVRAFADLLRQNCARTAKINCLADHDGFTLNDVFSYDERHNEANGEMNMDGREINYSWNCGVEGETSRRNIVKLRLRMIKNALSTLFLSQGTPMLLAGDEFGNTHHGNNNPYCCDNEQSWVVWEKTAKAREILGFTKSLIRLRSEHRVFSNKIELLGTDYIYKGCPDVSFHGTKAWFPDYGYYSRTLGILLNGEYAVVDRNKRDRSFYIAFNMHWEEHEFDLPGNTKNEFVKVLSTDPDNSVTNARTCIIKPRSIAVFEMKEIKENKDGSENREPKDNRAAKAGKNKEN